MTTFAFREFEKIHRLGKEEVEGILEGECLIQEKIDGANTSIWKDGTGTLRFASRKQEITSGFNGFIDYVNSNKNISKLLEDSPYYRLYGEWLVPHTVNYNKDSYKKWYMYDIYDNYNDTFCDPSDVVNYADCYNILYPYTKYAINNPTIEYLKELVGISSLGDKGEGIVIKNHKFINRWGNRCYAKLVSQEFLEDNALVFDSNSKASESYTEMYFVNKYMQKSRVNKICQKLQPEISERLDLKHIPRIINTAYYDMISEEAWEIAKANKVVNFSRLKTLCLKKAKLLYMEILNES